MTPEEQIKNLREQIAYHSDRYYNQDNPEISDYEFDQLMLELKRLEREHPELVTPDSPTQKMQRQMEEAQKELEEKEVTAAAGGGAVEVTVSGKHEITKVKLSPEVVDPDDIEMLEDLIMAATNEAYRQLDEFSQSSMAKITGGMGGLGGMPF